MCGLIGIYDAKQQLPHPKNLITSSCKIMRHRGPDNSSIWQNNQITFGFNRLAVIDLEKSDQPLTWGPTIKPDKYTLVFNGEIYNYLELKQELTNKFGTVFNTNGDGEVIAAAIYHWGENALEKFRGMFAFALWDSETHELTLGRDRFGIKPLFYSKINDVFIFGSEKKSLLNIVSEMTELNLNEKAIQEYFDFQYVPETETLHNQIQKIPSASFIKIDIHGNEKTTQYFTPDFSLKNFSRKPNQYYFDKITTALSNSVAKHMRSDVTVGSFLSGGIDSTAIATLAKTHNPKLITFTTGFAQTGYSEFDIAEKTAQVIGSEHISLKISTQMFIDMIPKIIWYLDDPVADPALVPLFFLAKIAREKVKVVLSGEGADELFGGYSIYHEPISLKLFSYLPNSINKIINRTANLLPDKIRGKNFLLRGSTPITKRYYGNARTFNAHQLEKLLINYHPNWSHENITRDYYLTSKNWDPVAQMQFIDINTWLTGDILVKADKMTMANSLELRVPFLDIEVYEAAKTLPTDLKLSNGTTKYALRQALKTIIPPHVINQPKLGFPVPIRNWLKQDLMYNWANDLLHESNTKHILNFKYINYLLSTHHKGLKDYSRHIWNILIFIIWHGIFVEKRIKVQIENHQYPIKI